MIAHWVLFYLWCFITYLQLQNINLLIKKDRLKAFIELPKIQPLPPYNLRLLDGNARYHQLLVGKYAVTLWWLITVLFSIFTSCVFYLLKKKNIYTSVYIKVLIDYIYKEEKHRWGSTSRAFLSITSRFHAINFIFLIPLYMMKFNFD